MKVAYKAFNSNLESTLGKGYFKMEVGQTYRENFAQTASTGFHCCENPLDVLRYHSGNESRYCIVIADGDINEDGDHRIACTEISIVREVSFKEILMMAAVYIYDHPDMPLSSLIKDNIAYASGGFVAVKGVNPEAAGELGDYLLLIKTNKHEVELINLIEVDGVNIKSKTYYNINEEEVEKCSKQN